MNYIDILNSDYFKETYSKIEELKKDFPVNHGFIHINNVIENAKRLSVTFKLTEKETDLLLIACALHDIGYLNGRDDHAYNGSLIAKEVLEKWDFNENDIKIISTAIGNHGGKDISNYSDIISICLIIADKIDFISTRYDSSRLKEAHSKTFPTIKETYLDYLNDELTLNVIVTNEFPINSFKESSYYNKLTTFLTLLSERLNAKYKIEFKI